MKDQNEKKKKIEQAPPKCDANNISDILNNFCIHSMLFVKFISIFTAKFITQPVQYEIQNILIINRVK